MDAIKRPIYRSKDGKPYEFMGEARVEELGGTTIDAIWMVVYRSVYDGSLFVSPFTEFYREFDYIPSEER